MHVAEGVAKKKKLTYTEIFLANVENGLYVRCCTVPGA